MKKLFTILSMIVVLFVSSKAQDIDLLQFSAKDGYDYLQDNYDDTGKTFFGLMTSMSVEDKTTQVDFNEGTSNVWTYIYLRKSGEAMMMSMVMVMKTEMGYSHNDLGEYEYEDWEEMYSINEGWIDSRDLALNVKNNTELINYWIENEDKIQSLYVTLTGTPVGSEEQYPENVWGIEISLIDSDEETATCLYNAADGVLFSCEYPTTSVFAQVSPFNNIAYPNPSNGQVNLTNQFIGDVNVIVINNAGQRVKSFNTISNNSIEINLSDLPNGNYNVITIQNNKFDAIKVNIQK